MRAFAMTGIETASTMPAIRSGSLILATPPWARMSAGTRSSAMTATAPASSAIFAWSAVTTSMMTPPFSISARPRFTRLVPVPVVGVVTVSVMLLALPVLIRDRPFAPAEATLDSTPVPSASRGSGETRRHAARRAPVAACRPGSPDPRARNPDPRGVGARGGARGGARCRSALGPGGGQGSPGAAEQGRQRLRLGDDREEVGVSPPPRHDVLVEVVRDTRPRDPPLVQPDVEAVAPGVGAEHPHRGLGERRDLRGLLVGGLVVQRHVPVRADQQVARVVGEQVEDHVRRPAPRHDQGVLVGLLRRGAEGAAAVR